MTIQQFANNLTGRYISPEDVATLFDTMGSELKSSFSGKHFYNASYVARRISDKYLVNPAWVWDEIAEQYGIEPGSGGLLEKEEATDLELFIAREITMSRASDYRR